MSELWVLNKPKFRYVAIWIYSVWFIICTIVFAKIYLAKGLPDITLKFAGSAALLLLALPSFILSILYVDLWYTDRLSRPLFAASPLKDLDRIGFNTSYRNQQSKWAFTEIYWMGLFDGFTVEVFTTKNTPRIILFKAHVKHQTIEKEQFREISSSLREKSISFDIGSLVKSIPVKKISQMDLAEIQQELFDFTHTLKQLNLEPDTASA